MGEDDFWDAVGLLDWGSEGAAAVAEPLVAHLAALPNGELFAFDDALAEHLRALDRRDVADRTFGRARGRLFPDDFLGWRCACVAAGRDRYADALAGRPAPPPGERFEEFMFAPMRAWARKHGDDSADYPHEPYPSFQTYANEEGWS